jgi:PIN domain nuclease of toxin-antitoxin system
LICGPSISTTKVLEYKLQRKKSYWFTIIGTGIISRQNKAPAKKPVDRIIIATSCTASATLGEIIIIIIMEVESIKGEQ